MYESVDWRIVLNFCSDLEDQGKASLVTKFKVGDKILLSLQCVARHIGVQIEEFIAEK